jgi:lactoylglutathione lyase
MMKKTDGPIRGLAEVSIRVHDYDAMRRFYEEVIGLEVLREIDEGGGRAVFFRLGTGELAHNLALFEESMTGWAVPGKAPAVDPDRTTLHHIAFDIALEAYETEQQRIAALGIELIKSRAVVWMKAHTFYFLDPEGNLIEYKSHDPGIQ